jgi:sporulation protein YlmC with PRC-barrel domain
MRNRWMRILTVSAACGFGAVTIAQTQTQTPTDQNRPGQTTGQTGTFRQSDWQRIGTPAQAADMFRGEKHSLVNGIQAAERAVGGHAIRAECRMKSDPTVGSGVNAGGSAGRTQDRTDAVGGGAGTGGQGASARAGAKNTDVVCVVTCLVGDSRFVEVFVDSRGQILHRDDQSGVGAASIDRERSRVDREIDRSGMDPNRNRDSIPGLNGNDNGSDWNTDRTNPRTNNAPDNGNYNYNSSRMSANFGSLGLAAASAGDKGNVVAAQQVANQNGNYTGHTGTTGEMQTGDTMDGRRHDHARMGERHGKHKQFAAATRYQKGNDLIGKAVTNNANENLGRVEDIVIDANTGRILYGVVSFGGFLGLGEKWFAVPWESLQLQGNAEKLVMNFDKETLRNAEGFDKSNWPDFANQRWATNTYRTYNVQPYWNEQRLAADTSGNTVTGQSITTSSGYRHRWNQAPTKWTKVSDLDGVDVLNGQNEKIGDIYNTAIDPDGGRILFAVIDLDNADLVAVPWQSVELRCEGDNKADKKLIVNMTHDQLKNMGTFTNDQWPNLTDRTWNTQTFQRYQVQPYWDGGE